MELPPRLLHPVYLCLLLVYIELKFSGEYSSYKSGISLNVSNRPISFRCGGSRVARNSIAIYHRALSMLASLPLGPIFQFDYGLTYANSKANLTRANPIAAGRVRLPDIAVKRILNSQLGNLCYIPPNINCQNYPSHYYRNVATVGSAT